MNERAVELLARLRRNRVWKVTVDAVQRGEGPVFIDLVSERAQVVVEAAREGYGVSVLSHVNGGYDEDYTYQTADEVLAFLRGIEQA